MKRFLCLLLTAMMILTMTACGGKDVDKDPNGDVSQNGDISPEATVEPTPEGTPEYMPDFQGRKIRYLAAWDQADPERGLNEKGDLWADKVDAMKEKYNFEFEYLVEHVNDMANNFLASCMTGQPMAEWIILPNHKIFPGMYKKNVLYPLNESPYIDLTEPKWDRVTLDVNTYGGTTYAVRWGTFEPRGLMYFNKALFEKNGIDPESLYELQKNKQWTWDKFLEFALATNDPANDVYGSANITDVQALVLSNGAEMISFDENGQPSFTLDSEAGLEALQFYQDLINKHKVVDTLGSEWDYPLNRFAIGKNAMLYGEMWNANSYFMESTDDYGIIMYPMGPKASEYASLGGELVANAVALEIDNADDVTFLLNVYSDPNPWDEPDDWKLNFERQIRDEGSLDSIQYILENPIMKLTNDRYFPGTESWNFMWMISGGDVTPKAAMEEWAPKMQQVIDDIMAEVNAQ